MKERTTKNERPQYKRTEVRDIRTGGIIAIQLDLVLTPQLQEALEEFARS